MAVAIKEDQPLFLCIMKWLNKLNWDVQFKQKCHCTIKEMQSFSRETWGEMALTVTTLLLKGGIVPSETAMTLTEHLDFQMD